MSNYILTSESTHADYLSLENKLITEFIDYATGATVTTKDGKEGYVSKFSVFSGPLFNQLLAIVQFDDGPVKYSVKAAFKDAGFLTFKDIAIMMHIRSKYFCRSIDYIEAFMNDRFKFGIIIQFRHTQYRIIHPFASLKIPIISLHIFSGMVLQKFSI